MNNEFCIISNKSFELNKEEDVREAIINEKDTHLEIEIRDADMFNNFLFWNKDNKKTTTTQIYYAINKNGNPITLFDASIVKNIYRAIPTAIVNSTKYLIGTNNNFTKSPYEQKHFTENTKVKRINYFNETIINLLGTKVFKKTETKDKFELIATRQKEKTLAIVQANNYKITINYVDRYEFNYINRETIIKPKNYFAIKFSKVIDIEESIKISNRVDTILHMLTLTKKRSNKLEIITMKKDQYNYFDLKHNNNNKSNYRMLFKNDYMLKAFEKLCNLFLNIDEEEANSYFIFLHFDRPTTSNEILFLEYYRVIEYMHKIKQNKKGKGKNPLFLKDILDKYSDLVKKYFGNDAIETLEEEIRSLRNYYSHYGYYIKILPVPTDNTKYSKNITIDWLYKVKMIMKSIAYLEMYELAGIDINSADLDSYMI